MKKRFALLTLCAAFAVSACGSSHKAKPPGTDVNFKPEFTSVGFSAFSDELAKKTNDLPALEQLSSDTASLAAIEDTAFADADNQDVPRFTADCVQLEPLGVRWTADLANISKNFPAYLLRVRWTPPTPSSRWPNWSLDVPLSWAHLRRRQSARTPPPGLRRGLAERPEGTSPAAVGVDYVNLHHLDRDYVPRTGVE